MNDEPNRDELWMEEALRLAARAELEGEAPVGALVVCNGEVIGRGYNRVISLHDPTAHAEIQALREAAQHIENYRLTGCSLYVTLEPCAMCAGAITHARIAELIYGADDAKAGACGGTNLCVLNQDVLNHKVTVRDGVLAARCREQLQAFFRSRRAR